MRFYFEFHFDQGGGFLAHLHDPLAAGVALDPGAGEDTACHRRCRADRHADARHDDRRLEPSLGREPTGPIGIDVDPTAFFDRFIARVGAFAPNAGLTSANAKTDVLRRKSK